MLISLILMMLVTLGGFGLTYFFADDEPFLWRVGAGSVVGSAAFGTVCFPVACLLGFTPLTILLSLLLLIVPALILTSKYRRDALQKDWRQARASVEGANFEKAARFGYYAFFLVLFWMFFDRAMLETAQGIFTGGSQNLGDLPFHLGAIFSFTDGGIFPPENPSFAFSKFSYPFMADMIAAAFVACGAKARDAMFVQNVTLAFALLVILERFTFKFTGSRLAGKIAPVILFFCGGLGFVWMFKDFWQGAQSLTEFLWKMPHDYTISENFRWGNSLVTLFLTQRGLLLGMPLMIIVLQKLWNLFNSEIAAPNGEIKAADDKSASANRFPKSYLIVGLCAGTLPLIHVHSLAVLFVVSAFLFFFRIDRWREWLTFGIGVSIIAVPELLWSLTGSASRLTEFIAWNFGWDKGDLNFVWFWLKNTGAFIPLLIFGLWMIFRAVEKNERLAESNDSESIAEAKNAPRNTPFSPFTIEHLYFYLPLLFCFLISNLIKLAPWQWDNIKVLIYWFVGSIPFVALVLAELWKRNILLKIVAAVGLFALTFSGAIDVWRTVTNQTNNSLFSKDAIAVAEQIKAKTAPDALFLNAPTFNSAVVLTGRRSLMRYTGHLFSYGINFGERENDVRKIYAGDATAEILLKKYGIQYVIISPEEMGNVEVNEAFFSRFPVIAETGGNQKYRVYKVAN